MLEYQLTQHGLRVEPGVENMSLIRLSQAAVRFQHKCSSTSPTIPRRLNSQKSVRSTLSTTMCPSQFCSDQERPLAGARGCRVNRDPLLQTRKGVLTCRRERSVHADSEREAALLTSSLFPFMNAWQWTSSRGDVRAREPADRVPRRGQAAAKGFVALDQQLLSDISHLLPRW